MPQRTRREWLRLTGATVTCIAVAAGSTVSGREFPLAIQGYDPVAYFTIGKAVPGSAAFEIVWDEHRYRFARAEHREMFKSAPASYAPRFDSYCTMALTRGEFVEGDPEHWLISDGKLYVFARRIGLERFREDPSGNAEAAQGTWLRMP